MRHASDVLKMMPNKTDRHDARGLAQIVRTGWFKTAQIKSHDAYVNRATLTAREALVSMRVKLEKEIRGLLTTFGIMTGQAGWRVQTPRRGDHRRRAGGSPRVAADLRSAHAGPARCPGSDCRAREPDPGDRQTS